MPRKNQYCLPEFWWEPTGYTAYTAHVNILHGERVLEQLPFELTVVPLFGQDEGKWSWTALLLKQGRFSRTGVAPTLDKAKTKARVAAGAIYGDYLLQLRRSRRKKGA